MTGSGDGVTMVELMEVKIIAIVALAIALFVGICLTLVIMVTCCLLFRTRKDLRVLRRKVDYAIVTGRKEDEVSPQQLKEHEFKLEPPAKSGSSFKDRREGGEEGERSDISPLITPTTTPTTAAVHVPVTTQPAVTKAVQINPVEAEVGGYSAVNVLSILPDEVRTEENLEGGSLPPDQAVQMLADYNKQRQEYEERELRKMAAISSSVGSKTGTEGTLQKQSPPNSSGGLAVQISKQSVVKTLNFTPGYEDMEPSPYPGYDMVIPLSNSAPVSNNPPDVGGSEYEDPADAVHHDIGVHKLRGGAVVAPKSQISPDKPKKFQLTTNLDMRYTDVYNPGEGETIGQPAPHSQKGKPETTTPNNVVNGTHPSTKLVHHYQNTSGGGEGSEDSLDEFQRGVDRKEPIRTSKKHKSAKEEVEFDPTSKKVFRVTSTKKRREANVRDFADNSGYSNGDSSPDAKLEKEKQFNMSDENSGGEEYSMVNVADKCKYRTEDDVMKKEGSGVPQRYSVSKSPSKQEVA